MKKFLALSLISLFTVAVVLAQTEDKVELDKIEVPSRLEMKVDLVEVYDGMEAVAEETLTIINRETLYSTSTVIMVMAYLKVEYADGKVALIPAEICFAITHYGDIGISLEKGDFNKDGRVDVLLVYNSGDRELIYFNPKYQSIDIVPYEQK